MRIRTAELRQMNRRHWHPVTANLYKLKDIENSNFYNDITSSPALTEADYIVAEEEGVLNEIYMAQDDYMANKEPKRLVESIPYDRLIEHARGEDKKTDKDEITTEMIDERKNILINHFKAAESKRREEEEKQKAEAQRIEQRRRREDSGTADKKKKSRMDYGYSEFDIGGVSELFNNSVRQ